jgi:hypothetical protein
MATQNTPIVHLPDPDQFRIRAYGFESMTLSFCDRWFPYLSRALVPNNPIESVVCELCLAVQRDRRMTR